MPQNYQMIGLITAVFLAAPFVVKILWWKFNLFKEPVDPTLCCTDPTTGNFVQVAIGSDALAITVFDSKGGCLSTSWARLPEPGPVGTVCATGKGTLLVPSTRGLLNEFTLDGLLVRCLPVNGGTYTVDCTDASIVVASKMLLSVLKYRCGSVQNSITKGHLEGNYAAVRFSPSGDFVHAAEPMHTQVRVFTAEGKYVRRYGYGHLGHNVMDIAFVGSSGDVAVLDAESGRVLLFNVRGKLVKVLAKNLPDAQSIAVSWDMLAVTVLGRRTPIFIPLK